MVGELYEIGAGAILRPRELRIDNLDEKMQVSIEGIFKERETFFHHRQWLTVYFGV